MLVCVPWMHVAEGCLKLAEFGLATSLDEEEGGMCRTMVRCHAWVLSFALLARREATCACLSRPKPCQHLKA